MFSVICLTCDAATAEPSQVLLLYRVSSIAVKMGLVGQVMSLPNMLFWYGAWFTASVARPIALATVLCLLANPKAAQTKLKLFATTFQFLFLSKDKKWKKTAEDPASFFKDGEDDPKVTKKTVIFLRHGESTWNDTFNKGDRKLSAFIMGFFPGVFKSFATEWYFLVSGQCYESWFFDSPLSAKGISQAEAVAKFLRDTDPKFATPKEARLLKLIVGEETDDNNRKCQLISSNLRRAISTCSIALQDRLDKYAKDDKILILEELQEASINPDALSIAPAKAPLVTAFTDSDRVKEIYATQSDTSLNKGNKPLDSNGLKRMQSFCKLLFDGEHIPAQNVLCTGHSYWFRAFFQTYLPKDFEHVSKKKKLINGGVVGFTMWHKKADNGDDKYMIDPKSLVILYGGF
ncbi:histidine phosphatase superfamily protein [Nitzschia inconspicua]|uniref:Histidine phosphatase superfamily protein n=1 Tax=Nitzschia inconspicua TaxID=303405 RepID=A0A9K3KVP4_9STRA|nr:histidine phosphatase superfamily protein [Nitzschia inconspicua]